MPSRLPDYDGGSLVNLIAELERRLTGSSPSAGLHRRLGALIPDAPSYVLVVCDGLGASQLGAAPGMNTHLAADIDTVFPSTTTVALSTLATALPPSKHGILGYQLWMPELGEVANTIHWTTLWGDPLDVDAAGLLPRPNVWERLHAAGLEPITVQPANFAATPLTRMLYRGCRFEGYRDLEDGVAATIDLVQAPRRLVVLYMPHVDFAAHVAGQDSGRYVQAVRAVEASWSRLAARLPGGVTAVCTADHGHVDFPPERRCEIDRSDHEGRVFYGDGRVMFVKGEGRTLAEKLPATWMPATDMEAWWGEGPRHSSFAGRAPDGVLVADPGMILLHRFSDRRLIGGHGGLTDEELRVPLLVAGG